MDERTDLVVRNDEGQYSVWLSGRELPAEMVTAIGVALAGRVGSRLAARLGLATGRDVLLRNLRRLPEPEVGAVPRLEGG